MNKVLILGGYGNFGQRIATALAKSGVTVVIAGRDQLKASEFAKKIKAQALVLDINHELSLKLQQIKPQVLINTCGPFQDADYRVAELCIEQGIHYIDIADGRDFVSGISDLDAAAQNRKVSVISGASSVPALSSAVLETYKDKFSKIESLVYGISPGQKSPRGLATVKSILSYLGRKIELPGDQSRYGWQDLYSQSYPELGNRWMANCDIPDLVLFPAKYNIQSIRFSAGMESRLLHFSIWILSWLVRLKFPIKPEKYAKQLSQLSHLFDRLGTANSGMHVIITGFDQAGKPQQQRWFLVAKDDDGPQVPCIPAIILSKKLLTGKPLPYGAFPCVNMISLTEYLNELEGFKIKTYAFPDIKHPT